MVCVGGLWALFASKGWGSGLDPIPQCCSGMRFWSISFSVRCISCLTLEGGSSVCSFEGDALSTGSLGLLNVHMSIAEFCNLLLRGEIYGFEMRFCPRGSSSVALLFPGALSEDFGYSSSPPRSSQHAVGRGRTGASAFDGWSEAHNRF